MADYRTATEKIKLKTNTDHSFFFRSEAERKITKLQFKAQTFSHAPYSISLNCEKIKNSI